MPPEKAQGPEKSAGDPTFAAGTDQGKKWDLPQQMSGSETRVQNLLTVKFRVVPQALSILLRHEPPTFEACLIVIGAL